MLIDEIAKKMLDVGYTFPEVEKRFWSVLGDEEFIKRFFKELEGKTIYSWSALETYNNYAKMLDVIYNKTPMELIYINGIKMTLCYLDSPIIIHISNHKKWDGNILPTTKISLDKIDDLDVIVITDRIELC